ESAIAFLQEMMAAQAVGSAHLVEMKAEPAALPAPGGHSPEKLSSKRKPNRLMIEVDTAIGPQEGLPRKVRAPADQWSLRYGASSSSNGMIFRCGAMDPASSVPPKILESVGRHFGVSDGVLNVLVPEVMLQGPRVVAVVGQLESTGMAKHVRVDRERHLGSLTEALDKTVETDGADCPAALGNEYVGICRVIAA